MNRSKIRDYLVSAMTQVESWCDRDSKRAAIYDNLRKVVADEIVHTRMTKTEGSFHNEYRIEVYVLPADELFRLIRQEAMEISRQMSMEATDGRTDGV